LIASNAIPIPSARHVIGAGSGACCLVTVHSLDGHDHSSIVKCLKNKEVLGLWDCVQSDLPVTPRRKYPSRGQQLPFQVLRLSE
jgi:hypothetical protein